MPAPCQGGVGQARHGARSTRRGRSCGCQKLCCIPCKAPYTRGLYALGAGCPFGTHLLSRPGLRPLRGCTGVCRARLHGLSSSVGLLLGALPGVGPIGGMAGRVTEHTVQRAVGQAQPQQTQPARLGQLIASVRCGRAPACPAACPAGGSAGAAAWPARSPPRCASAPRPAGSGS